MNPPSDLVLRPGEVTLAELEDVYRRGTSATLDRACRETIERAAAHVAAAAAGARAVYGVNTGFGKLATVRIAAGDTAALQRNLIRSHCAGVGEPTSEPVVRLMMTLKLLSLGRGASGVRWSLVELLEGLLARGVSPRVPAQGSVGASGDLAPLAHMTAVLIGEGEATFDGATLPGAAALEAAGLEPLALGPKEGLALINGTQFSTAHALAGLFDAWRLAEAAIVTGALTTDAVMGSTAPLRAEIHALRGHRGQIDVARATRALMAGSAIRESHREGDTRVQDPYCIRCQAQVTGACVDLLRQSGATLVIEANAATDNPLVLGPLVPGGGGDEGDDEGDDDGRGHDGEIVSGGNFHAEPVGFAADQIALAVAEIGSIAQRRVALMVDPTLSFDLPAFLTPAPGLNSGLMIAEVTSAALMSENRHLAHPCTIDSTPTSANQEDHVSMAAHGARRLHAMNVNLATILGIEAIGAAQGIEWRAPTRTSPRLERALACLRAAVAPLAEDRVLAPDLARARELVVTRALVEAAGDEGFPRLEPRLEPRPGETSA